MKNKMKFLTYGIFVLFLGFASCNGEDGAMGPAGQNGVDGQDGNANVIASDWIATDFSTTASRMSTFEITDSNITAENVDNAAVLAFGKSFLGIAISVPFVFNNKSYYYALIPNNNKIRFIGAAADGSTSEIFGDISEVRYVIIPSTANKGGKKRDFTKMSYEEVMDYFNLAH